MEQMQNTSSNKLYQHINLADNLIETVYEIVFEICRLSVSANGQLPGPHFSAPGKDT